MAIEEQFYLLWPIAFVALRSGRGRRRVLVIVAVPGSSRRRADGVCVRRPQPVRVYYGTDTRAHSSSSGACSRCCSSDARCSPSTYNVAVQVVGDARGGRAVIAVRSVATTGQAMYRGGFLVYAVAVAVVIAAAVQTDALAVAARCSPTTVALGRHGVVRPLPLALAGSS